MLNYERRRPPRMAEGRAMQEQLPRGVLKQIPFVLWFLVAGLAVIPACDAKEPPNPTTSAAPSPYPILDSGVWAVWDSVFPGIYWIDNQRVFFKTVKDNNKSRVSSGPFNLSIWDTTTNKVTPYTEYANSLTVCYREGFIHYSLADEPFYVQQKNWRHFAGEFGKEKPYALPVGKNVIYNELSCRFQINSKLVEKRKTRGTRFLLDRHGYLDLGPNHGPISRTALTTFYRAGISEGIEIPIPVKHISTIQYCPYLETYLVYGLNTGGIPNKKKQFWWLYPDGTVKNDSFHIETHLYPTRKGIVTKWGGTKSAKDPGTVGLYLWKGKEPIKLIAGYAEGVTVSPDGCKLAFVHFLYSDATKISDPGRITLKSINVCSEEKSHG